MNMGTFTANGWLAPATPMPEHEWVAALQQVSEHHNAYQWQLGDLWAYGEHAYGNRKALTEAQGWRGPSFQACVDAATVARKFNNEDQSKRRRVLSFTHHREAVTLPDALAGEMLDWAEREGKSSRDLRARVAQWKATPSAIDITQRVEAYLVNRGLADLTKDKLRRVAKRAPDLAVRVLDGELKINTAYLGYRDREVQREADQHAAREAAMAQRRAASTASASIVLPFRRTAEEERQHVRDTAEALLLAARAGRKVTAANVSADALMRVLTPEQCAEINAHLRACMYFYRNVLNTLAINNRSESA